MNILEKLSEARKQVKQADLKKSGEVNIQESSKE